jgi:hypothetical protein
MKIQVTIALNSDFANGNQAIADYFQDHAVDATVEVEWVPETDEQFDQHGGSYVTRYWRLCEWTLVELSLDGKALEADAVPAGFPMQEVLSIVDGSAFRDDLERIGPGAEL